MTDSPASFTPHPDDEQHAVAGGGGALAPADQLANDPVRNAAAKLELLSEETRESVLARMDPQVAQRIRDYIASQPDSRPHGHFSTDVTTRRQLIHDMADRVATRRTAATDQMVAEMDGVPKMAQPGMPAQMPGQPPRPGADGSQQPAGSGDPLDQLRGLHPAAIARAMQGERAEAWAIVLDRLDVNARAALQLYLDATARTAIDDARARQADLAATSPALIATVVAAIARTVVPRAMREHHQLLSTTPLAWTGQQPA
ncbi:MAG: hypothetical protein ABI200_06570 [Gaiellales bacterium]